MPEASGERAASRRPRRLAHVLAAFSRAVRREMERDGVDVREWTILAFLSERPYSSNAELSRRIGVTPQAVHTVVLALEKRALIERHPDPHHGRIARFTLTGGGGELLERYDVIADEVERRAVGDLSAAERRTLVASAVNALRRLEHPEGTAPEAAGAPAPRRARQAATD
jgi:DNA-binding MarR family transcriptional regulator